MGGTADNDMTNLNETPRRRRSCAPLAVLCGAAMVLLAACQSPKTSAQLSDSDYVDNFETIAFYREFDPDKRARRLTRWEEPLNVALVGDVTDRYLEYTLVHLDEISDMSGLPINIVGPENKANVVVIFSPDPFRQAVTTYRDVYRPFFSSERLMEKLTAEMEDQATCYGRIVTADDRPNEIVAAVILIPTDLGRFIVRACIIEELTQAMGLFNDSDDVEPSIFNDSSPNMALTDHDRILFRLLYDRRLSPGMSWPEAEPIVRQAVTEIRT